MIFKVNIIKSNNWVKFQLILNCLILAVSQNSFVREFVSFTALLPLRRYLNSLKILSLEQLLQLRVNKHLFKFQIYASSHYNFAKRVSCTFIEKNIRSAFS